MYKAVTVCARPTVHFTSPRLRMSCWPRSTQCRRAIQAPTCLPSLHHVADSAVRHWFKVIRCNYKGTLFPKDCSRAIEGVSTQELMGFMKVEFGR